MLEKILKDYYAGDKVFIVGTYGVGKTTFAEEYSKKYSVPFKCFDNKFQYMRANDENYVTEFINQYPEKFIVDSIPYGITPKSSPHPDYSISINFIKQTNTKVLCIICLNPVVWFNRLVTTKKIFHAFKGLLKRSKNSEEAVYNGRQIMLTALNHFSNFYYKYFQQLVKGGIECDIFDSFTNTFITLDIMYKRIYWAEPELVKSMLLEAGLGYYSPKE